jgi:hypothetical protein
MLTKLEDRMMTAIDNVSFIRHDGQLLDDYAGYAKATAKVAEEYASEKTAEKDLEMATLRENVDRIRGQSLDKIRQIEVMVSEMENRNNELQKELSDFKALVKQMREKQINCGNDKEELRYDLQSQVDKYLQE